MRKLISNSGATFKVKFKNKVVNRRIVIEITYPGVVETEKIKITKVFKNQNDVIHYLEEYIIVNDISIVVTTRGY